MTSPDRRARERDREAAIAVVRAAWADGQIVEVDRDRRVEELRRAPTLSEIAMLTRDLRPATSRSTPGRPPVMGVSGTPLNLAPARSPKRVRRGLLAAGLAVAVLLGVGLAAGSLVRESVITSDRATAERVVEGPGAPALIGGGGFTGLVASIEDRTGSDLAFRAVVYPRYAVVNVPVDASSRRQRSLYYNGSLRTYGPRSTTDAERFSLGDVDGEVMARLVRRARRLLDGPTTAYVVLTAPDDRGGSIAAYATNDQQDDAYLLATADGTIVTRQLSD